MNNFTTAFNDLLATWRRREDARVAGNIQELAKARVDLDAARARMTHIR